MTYVSGDASPWDLDALLANRGVSTREPIQLIVIGQSNDRGSVLDTVYPNAWASLRKPEETVPIWPAKSAQGGWWHYVMDELYDWGYDASIINGGIGSMSMIAHGSGVIGTHDGYSSVIGHRQRRSSTNEDRGYAGARIAPVAGSDSPVWVLTGGANDAAAFSDGPVAVLSQDLGFISQLDYMLYSQLTKRSGGARFTATFSGTTMTVSAMSQGTISVGHFIYGYAGFRNSILAGMSIVSQLGGTAGGVGTYQMNTSFTRGTDTLIVSSPANFAFTAVGATVTDGDFTWTCESPNAVTFYGGFFGTVLTETQIGRGFDPVGILSRAHAEAQRVRNVKRRIVYIANGQSDISATSANYSSALQAVANYFLTRGYEVMIGLTMYMPTANNITGYNNLQTGRTSALAALNAGAYAAKVHDGADLYALMGTTGPMGGWGGTAAIASNVMTVSATTFGNISVGHVITNASFGILGTVASLGTWNGTTGTLNLTGGVNTASQAMTSSGQFFQTSSGNRNVHINGAGAVGPDVGGVSCAGKHVADAFKAFLPQR